MWSFVFVKRFLIFKMASVFTLMSSNMVSAQFLDFNAFQRGADMARQQNQQDIYMQQEIQMRQLELQRLQRNAQQQEERILIEQNYRQYGPSLPAILVKSQSIDSRVVCHYVFFEMENKKDFSVNSMANGYCAQSGQVWPKHNRFRASIK